MVVRVTLVGAAATLIIGGFVTVDRINAGRSEQIRQTQVDACVRGNTLRGALYRNTVRDYQTRAAAAAQFTGEAQRKITLEAEGGAKDAKALLRSVADVAKKPGSPQVNCEEAYPK